MLRNKSSCSTLTALGTKPSWVCYYDEVYQRFCQAQYTLATDKRDYPSWHQHRGRYWFWAIEIDDADIISRLHRIQACLAPWLVDRYDRVAHITVAIGGFWQPELQVGVRNDDFVPAMLERQVAQLNTGRSGPFEVSVLGPNSFTSAPFLEVMDPAQSIDALRMVLMNPETNDFRASAYCPHITLGLYRARFTVADIIESLAHDISSEPLVLRVSSLALMSYDSRDVGSRLRVEQRLSL